MKKKVKKEKSPVHSKKKSVKSSSDSKVKHSKKKVAAEEKAEKRKSTYEKNIFVRPIQIMRGYNPKEPSERLIKVIALLVKSGNYPEVACRAVGVSKYVFRNWMERGLADIEAGLLTAYSAFALAIDAVEAQSECMNVSFIANRVHNWQALAWMLERKGEKRWGTKISHAVGGDADGTPIKTEDVKEVDSGYAGRLLAILESTVGLDALKNHVEVAEEEKADAHVEK